MAQEYYGFGYADTQQHPAPFPDGSEPWDAAVAQHQHGGGSVGPAPECQSGGHYYYDPEALALAACTYSVAVPPGPGGCYAPDLDLGLALGSHTPVEPEVAFDDYAFNDDGGVAHPSSAFGYLHYLPPAAISNKYYALQDPNVYPADSVPSTSSPSASSSYAPPPHHLPTAFEGLHSQSSPPAVDLYADAPPSAAWDKPEPEDQEQEQEQERGRPPMAAPPPSPLDVLATPTRTPTLTPSSAHFEDFREGWHHPTQAPSGPPERAHPVLPKQRRNRDDPGGDAGRLAQVCARSSSPDPRPAGGPGQAAAAHEVQTDVAASASVGVGVGVGVGFQNTYYGALPGAASHDAMVANGSVQQVQQEQEQEREREGPVVVPSQWKLGAVLDRLRFPQYGGDWDALMAAVHGEPYHARMPRSHSPLSPEELAQLEQLRVGFGLGLGLSARTTTPMTPITPATPATDGYNHDDADGTEKIVVYSPMTGRRIPVTAGPSGPVLQLGAVPPGARRTHRRGAVAACAFCRRRKIACGGPKEGDEARRCGQCIQRQQPCEFPGTSSYQHAHPVPLVAPPYSYAHPAHRVGDVAPR